jgi:hypothetical protein
VIRKAQMSAINSFHYRPVEPDPAFNDPQVRKVMLEAMRSPRVMPGDQTLEIVLEILLRVMDHNQFLAARVGQLEQLLGMGVEQEVPS